LDIHVVWILTKLFPIHVRMFLFLPIQMTMLLFLPIQLTMLLFLPIQMTMLLYLSFQVRMFYMYIFHLPCYKGPLPLRRSVNSNHFPCIGRHTFWLSSIYDLYLWLSQHICFIVFMSYCLSSFILLIHKTLFFGILQYNIFAEVIFPTAS
jgi:hypothetical protein